ncbi:MAG TPA: hypothetical protein VM901_04325 [Bdellovibrionota bacterium]|jgi:hypothetical protein|nr:hypothetical protein [Bdellovibrionota bacterium]
MRLCSLGLALSLSLTALGGPDEITNSIWEDKGIETWGILADFELTHLRTQLGKEDGTPIPAEEVYRRLRMVLPHLRDAYVHFSRPEFTGLQRNGFYWFDPAPLNLALVLTNRHLQDPERHQLTQEILELTHTVLQKRIEGLTRLTEEFRWKLWELTGRKKPFTTWKVSDVDPKFLDPLHAILPVYSSMAAQEHIYTSEESAALTELLRYKDRIIADLSHFTNGQLALPTEASAYQIHRDHALHAYDYVASLQWLRYSLVTRELLPALRSFFAHVNPEIVMLLEKNLAEVREMGPVACGTVSWKVPGVQKFLHLSVVPVQGLPHAHLNVQAESTLTIPTSASLDTFQSVRVPMESQRVPGLYRILTVPPGFPQNTLKTWSRAGFTLVPTKVTNTGAHREASFFLLESLPDYEGDRGLRVLYLSQSPHENLVARLMPLPPHISDRDFMNGNFTVKDILHATGTGHEFRRPRDSEVLTRLEDLYRYEAAARRLTRDKKVEERWLSRVRSSKALTVEEWAELREYLDTAYPQDRRVYEGNDLNIVTNRFSFDFAIWREASPLNWIGYSEQCSERLKFSVSRLGMSDTSSYLHDRLVLLAQYHGDHALLKLLARAWEKLPAPQPFARRLELAKVLARSGDAEIRALAEPTFERYREFLDGDDANSKDCRRIVDEAGS